MPEVTIQWWAILVGVAFNMILGSLWYSKLMFWKTWMGLVGVDEERAKQGANKAMFGMVVLAFITVYVMAHFVAYTKADTILTGLTTGLWLWLGFVVPVKGSEVLFAKRPVQLFLIDASYQLVALLGLGVLFALWQ